MKMKRLISFVIVLLLVCGMPVSAFAMDDNQAGNTVSLVPADDTMNTNYGIVTANGGTVTTNDGIVDYNYGTVGTNNKTVTTNFGEVTTNAQNGTVTRNGTATDNANAKVGTNNGRVEINDGTVDINNGTVEANNGTVKTNYDTGNVDTNDGTVTTNKGTVGTNNKTVTTNFGEVTTNAQNGTVTRNGTDTDNANAEVGTNNGTVVINEGTVDINNGTVETNFGTVKTNEITGDVINYDTGDVETNYGTVTVKGRGEEITFYGVQVDGSLLQKELGVELNLKEKFSKEGYVFAGYIMNWRMDADRGLVPMETPKKTDDYIYSLNHPNVLTLIWMAISGSGDGSGAEGEKPEYFGPGCYISLNGKQYILTEIKGEDYYLASCEEYTQEELAEAGELLESLLTEEQLSHVTGEAGILEGELNELFFGGGSRIVFPCDIGMIFY